MQVMDEDARRVSEVTGLKLSMAGDVASPAVLGGFPKNGLDAYIGKRVRAGRSVSIAFQNEAKERHVVEVIRLSPVREGILGADLRDGMRAVLVMIIQANDMADRAETLLTLRRELETLKVLSRLCQDPGAFAGGTRSYLHVAERLTGLTRQNEGWLKQTLGRGNNRRKWQCQQRQ